MLRRSPWREAEVSCGEGAGFWITRPPPQTHDRFICFPTHDDDDGDDDGDDGDDRNIMEHPQ